MTAAVAGTPLQTSFVFSYMRRGGGKQNTAKAGEEGAAAQPEVPPQQPHPYENSIKTIIEVSTVEGFWSTYDFLKRPNDLPTTTDYHFFRGGIKPTWEDPNNAKGGKWIVRLPKGLSSRYWEEVILALIGGQFLGVPDGEICGAVLSIRYSEDILGVWNKSATERELIDRIRDAIKKVLQLPAHANMEYKPHQTSMQDRSSFRNTQVWKPKSLEGRASSHAAPAAHGETRRSSSWAEREERKPKGRDMGRSWR
jgi:translation initiation factor 4E